MNICFLEQQTLAARTKLQKSETMRGVFTGMSPERQQFKNRLTKMEFGVSGKSANDRAYRDTMLKI